MQIVVRGEMVCFFFFFNMLVVPATSCQSFSVQSSERLTGWCHASQRFTRMPLSARQMFIPLVSRGLSQARSRGTKPACPRVSPSTPSPRAFRTRIPASDDACQKPKDDAVAPPNAVFVNLFNALGFFPAIMASMLVGGGSFQKGRQPVPAQPFVFGAFALGFFAVGPYLALRNYLPEQEEGEEMSTVEVRMYFRCGALAVCVLVPCFCSVRARACVLLSVPHER